MTLDSFGWSQRATRRFRQLRSGVEARDGTDQSSTSGFDEVVADR